MQRIPTSDGRHIATHVTGTGDPVLLIHGFAGSSASWGDTLLAEMSGDRRVIAVDLLGHGSSDRPHEPERYDLARILRDLLDVLDALELDAADWIGYSMGGRIALGAAVLHPDRVSRLVLESASPGIAGPAERAERRGADANLATMLTEEGIDAFATFWKGLPLFASRATLPMSTREDVQARLRINDPDALAACLTGVGTGTQPSLWDRLPEVPHPTLLLSGGLDAKFAGLADRVQQAMPQAQHVSIPGAGHTVHLERPKAWVEAVGRFLGA